jgi:amino-acid N-acetyltransferase
MDTGFSLRAAEAADAGAIRELILRVRINPTGLDWRRFILAVTPQGEMIGCGQVKPHGDGTYELASIAVAPAWRGRGVARAVIEALLAANPGPLYLTCRPHLETFYQKFGFSRLALDDLPPYFRRLERLSGALVGLHLMPGTILVMRRISNEHG